MKHLFPKAVAGHTITEEKEHRYLQEQNIFNLREKV
jgi:hypothetical protein